MDAVFYKRGNIRGVVAVIKSLASAISIGSGASVGREGPIIQILCIMPRIASGRATSSTGRSSTITCAAGFVTLPCREREVSAPQELSGRCDCSPPRGHRRSAKHAVRLG